MKNFSSIEILQLRILIVESVIEQEKFMIIIFFTEYELTPCVYYIKNKVCMT